MSCPRVARATSPPSRRLSAGPLLLAVGVLAAHGVLASTPAAEPAATRAAADPAAAPKQGAAAATETTPKWGPRARLARQRALELLRKQDPFERMNRGTYKFNETLDRAVTKPIARGYRAVVPIPVRKAVSNFVANLGYPTVIVNEALQGKMFDACGDTVRFVINSTFGIAGLRDPATHMGLPSHDEDFGQTLGHWGVHAGPYLVLPFLGPSDLRDAPARYVSHYTNLEYYPESAETRYALMGISLIDTRTELLAADESIESAFDPYTLVRNAYLARREYLVRDGAVPEENYEDLMDTPVDESPAATPAESPPTESPKDPAPQP